MIQEKKISHNKYKRCTDLELYGNCTKRENCEICNKPKKITKALDVSSSEFVPKKKLAEQKLNIQNEVLPSLTDKLNLNLEAKEYQPKYSNPNANNFVIRQMDNDDDNIFDDEEENNKEVEVIVRDIIENEEFEDEDESDDEKWFPKYKDCDCCQGFIYKCSGKACENLQYCYCKVKTECDDFY